MITSVSPTQPASEVRFLFLHHFDCLLASTASRLTIRFQYISRLRSFGLFFICFFISLFSLCFMHYGYYYGRKIVIGVFCSAWGHSGTWTTNGERKDHAEISGRVNGEPRAIYDHTIVESEAFRTGAKKTSHQVEIDNQFHNHITMKEPTSDV
jgi:hypothetical protein